MAFVNADVTSDFETDHSVPEQLSANERKSPILTSIS